MFFKNIKSAYHFKQSEGFRGFKRIKLSSYDYKPAVDGIRKLAKKNPMYIADARKVKEGQIPTKESTIIPKYVFDLSDCNILLFPKHSSDCDYIQVSCDGHIVVVFLSLIIKETNKTCIKP